MLQVIKRSTSSTNTTLLSGNESPVSSMIAKYKEQYPTQPSSINWYDMTDFYINSFMLEEHVVQPQSPKVNTWPAIGNTTSPKPKIKRRKSIGTWSF